MREERETGSGQAGHARGEGKGKREEGWWEAGRGREDPAYLADDLDECRVQDW